MRSIRFVAGMLPMIVAVFLITATGSAWAAMPEINGWTAAGEGGVYNRESLWEYINGAAEQFIAYGFQSLEVDDYTAGDITFTVFVYDMGTTLGAYGIYQAQRSDKAEPLAIGGEAVVLMPYQCLMYKDRFYLMADLYQGDMTAKIGADFLKALADAIPGSTEPPAALAQLPSKNRISPVIHYTPAGFLGLGTLKRCLHAEYQFDKQTRVTGFVVLPGKSQTIDAVWERLSATWTEVEDNKSKLLIRKIPYKGPVGLIKTKEAIFGISGLGDEKELVTRLREFSKQKQK